MSSNKAILFVTWDGPDVNYLEALFAPIFAALQQRYGYRIHIAQFTTASATKIQARKAYFGKLQIPYLPIPLSGRSVLWDLVISRLWHTHKLSRYIRQNRIAVLMPRAVTSLFLTKKLIQQHRLRLIWDADGFPLDERVDFASLSALSLRYRFFRDQEFQGFHLAHAMICRSEKAKHIIQARAGASFDPKKVFVIANGTISSLEKPAPVRASETLELVYAGSTGPQYQIPLLLGLVASLLPLLPQLRLTLITYQPEKLRNLLEMQYPQLRAITTLTSLPAEEVPEALRTAHIGVAFRTPTFSMQGVAPIKVSEYLAAGLSILYTQGTGDLDTLLEGLPFAYRITSESAPDIPGLALWIQQQAAGKHREAIATFAESTFGLEKTVNLYHQALQR